MIPFLAPLLETLAASGLSMLAGAIKSKGKEVIEEKLGVKIPDDPAKLTPEVLGRLREKEFEFEEFLIDSQLEEKRIDNANTADARNMNSRIQESANADHVAKVAAYYLDFVIVLSTMALAIIIFFVGVPTENKELAYMAFGSLLTLCGTIINFHRGTSSSSKKKDDTISRLMK